MRRFLEKFNRALGNRFNLRLSFINIYIKEKEAQFNFVASESEYEEILSNQEEIIRAVNSAFSTDLKVSLKIKKNHFDFDFFYLELVKFFDSVAALKNCISKKNITYNLNDDRHCIEILLRESEYLLFESQGLIKSLNDLIYSSYLDEILISVKKSEEKELFIDEETDIYVYDDPNGRFIDVIPNASLIGYMIYDKPGYIADALEPKEKITLCGRVTGLKEYERKKENSYKYYKFFLDDTTSRVECIFFANEKTFEAIKNLKEDDEVVVMGNLDYNIYNGVKTLNLKVNKITLCEFPKDFKINRLKYQIPLNYKHIYPTPYTEFYQQSLFDKSKPVSKYLLGKEFCVFDIETTGLSITNDKIIEIGATKIKDGIITETFSTLINPEYPISPSATQTHGLTDDDVRNSPTIDKILPDFLKFSANSILLGHNSEFFDFPILARQGAIHKIYFDNERLDSLVLAKKYLKLDNYKLSSIAKHYGVLNEQAHRAVTDAITTAKIFILMSEKM